MKRFAAVVAVLLMSILAFAQAPKPCEELKSEIAAKLDAKGVQSYTLEIVAKDKDAEGKVVGTCDGGTRKIVYRREAAAPAVPTPETKKP